MTLESESKNSSHGGKRKGAGRPKGTPDKPKITDSMTEEQIQSIIASALAKAEEGDSVLIKFLLEQYWGRARQAVFTEDEEGKTVPIQGFNYVIPDGKS